MNMPQQTDDPIRCRGALPCALPNYCPNACANSTPTVFVMFGERGISCQVREKLLRFAVTTKLVGGDGLDKLLNSWDYKTCHDVLQNKASMAQLRSYG